MKHQAMTAVLSLSVLAGCAGKKVIEDKTPVATGPVPISQVGFQIDLSQKGKDLLLGSTGQIVFRQALIGGAREQCTIPVVVSVSGNRKEFDKAVSKTLQDVFKRMNRPTDGTKQFFTTGYFQISGESVAPLITATVEQLTGKFSIQTLSRLKDLGPGATTAPVNEKNIGFALPLGEKFAAKGTTKLGMTVDFSPADDSGTNALCQKILKDGFKIEPDKADA